MRSIQRVLITGLVNQYLGLISDIKEGQATPEQQDEAIEVLEAIKFHTDRYLLFPPVPLTETKEDI